MTNATETRDRKLASVVKLAKQIFETTTKGHLRFLTDAVLRAVASDAVMSVMMTRYEAESERETPTDANLYVEAKWQLEKELGL
jgi:hypothetical protein